MMYTETMGGKDMNPVIVRNVKIGEGIPKICVPIVGKTKEEILEAANEILNVPADMVEWRVDFYESVFEIQKVMGLLKELREVLGEVPILFTFRTKHEGGEKELNSKAYAMLYKMVIESGLIDLVDVEVFSVSDICDSVIGNAHRNGVKVIGSNHDFEKTPNKEELVDRLCYMQQTGADILKIAVMPTCEEDVLTLLGATKLMVKKYAKCPVITMSMSGIGAISRISGELFGSAITFGIVKNASAPGQMGVIELKNMLEMMHKSLSE